MIEPIWPAPAHIKALSTTRHASVLNANAQATISRTPDKNDTASPYGFFNLGDHVGDNRLAVEHNRQHLLHHSVGCEDIRWLQQVHGIDCQAAESIKNGHDSDASFTTRTALGCAIMTADCLPVLFCDLEGRQVAAAHAGWKGLAQGVLSSTLKTFTNNGIAAHHVIAWLGPAISQTAFEVGPEVRDAFSHFPHPHSIKHRTTHRWADEQCFVASQADPLKGDRLKADLYRLARLQLEYLGIAGVYGAGVEQEKNWCTYSDLDCHGEVMFYSYRRQSQTGRQASLIWKTSS